MLKCYTLSYNPPIETLEDDPIASQASEHIHADQVRILQIMFHCIDIPLNPKILIYFSKVILTAFFSKTVEDFIKVN
jgi:hypothetical protein